MEAVLRQVDAPSTSLRQGSGWQAQQEPCFFAKAVRRSFSESGLVLSIVIFIEDHLYISYKAFHIQTGAISA
jgi:hypothetical protein